MLYLFRVSQAGYLSCHVGRFQREKGQRSPKVPNSFTQCMDSNSPRFVRSTVLATEITVPLRFWPVFLIEVFGHCSSDDLGIDLNLISVGFVEEITIPESVERSERDKDDLRRSKHVRKTGILS